MELSDIRDRPVGLATSFARFTAAFFPLPACGRLRGRGKKSRCFYRGFLQYSALPGRATRLSDHIELRFLLIVEVAVEIVESAPHGLHRPEHDIKPF
jgi:hypothetical protein